MSMALDFIQPRLQGSLPDSLNLDLLAAYWLRSGVYHEHWRSQNSVAVARVDSYSSSNRFPSGYATALLPGSCVHLESTKVIVTRDKRKIVADQHTGAARL